MSRALLVLFIALCLSACIDKGFITSKQDIPSHTYTYMQPVYGQDCSYNYSSKQTTCYQVVRYYIPVQQFVPEQWVLKVKSPDGKDTREFNVSRDTYNRARIGDFYNNKTGELLSQ